MENGNAIVDATSIEELKPDQWVDLYGDYLYRYALMRLRQQSAAEDVVQETFIAGLGSLDKYSGTASERAWLFGILKHKIIDYIRKNSRESALDDDQYMDKMIDDSFNRLGMWKALPNNWRENPTEVFENGEFWDIFESCISELPERTAQAFTLRELDGLDTDEICKVLDISSNNLWVMLHRARLKLRGCLETNWFGGK